MKKKIMAGLVLAGLSFGSWLTAEAAELRGFVKQFTNEQARSFVQQPSGRFSATQPGWNTAASLNGVGVTVQASDGTVVFSGTTGTTTTGVGGYFAVSNLPVGTYTVTLTSAGLTALPFSAGATVQPQMTATVQLTTDSEINNLNWILASQSKRVLALSKRGTFPGGTDDVDQLGNRINYRIWYQGGDVASLYTQNGINYVYFKGALYNDTIGLYSNALTEPTLTATEQAYGWEFKGWRINQSPTVYSSEEVANTRILTDITLEAVFEAPTYTVTFATDEEKGSIGGQSSTSYSVEGNGSTVTNLVNGPLPVADAKPGYTFLGWYTDQTTNLVSDTDILNTPVEKDLVYYAKYKKDVPAIAIGSNGNWYIDGVDTGQPSQGPAGPAGQNAQPLTITATSWDAAGNTIITFSDGSNATIKKGVDGTSVSITSTSTDAAGNTIVTFSDGTNIQVNKGTDAQPLTILDSREDASGNTVITFSDNSRVIVKKGQDAAAPQVEIGSNGNWFVNGVDTGKPSQGADGQNGQSLTIQKTELDADGNTLVTFSDGSIITIHKGTDAQAPQIYIGSNGNWFVNDVDTGKQAQGPQGQVGAAGQNGADGKDAQPLSIVTSKLDEAGNTVISFSDGSQVSVSKGQDGNNPVITIDSNGYWVVNGQLTTTKAKGEDGRDGQAPTVEIGSNGNWIINGKDTGVPAKGVDGKDGQVVTGQALGDNPVTTFVKGILPATGSEQNIALLLLFGSAFMLFGGYLLGRRKSDR